MYDPTLGRWLSEDPVGFTAADPNLYRYVGNNPTNATDPTGLSKVLRWDPWKRNWEEADAKTSDLVNAGPETRESSNRVNAGPETTASSNRLFRSLPASYKGPSRVVPLQYSNHGTLFLWDPNLKAWYEQPFLPVDPSTQIALGNCKRKTYEIDYGTLEGRRPSDQDKNLLAMSANQKVLAAMKRAPNFLEGEARKKLQEVFSEKNLPPIAGVATFWGVSHLFGVGEVADVGLGLLAYATMGVESIKVGKLVANGTLKAIDAVTERELDNAARDYAEAFAIAVAVWLESPEGTRTGVNASNDSLVARVLANFHLYPKVIDSRTGRHIPFPSSIVQRVPKGDRVSWGLKQRGEFIAEWYRRGYETPRGGWDKYDIHHIQPREFGGTNDFWNLVPVERQTHQKLFTAFWNNFIEL